MRSERTWQALPAEEEEKGDELGFQLAAGVSAGKGGEKVQLSAHLPGTSARGAQDRKNCKKKQ